MNVNELNFAKKLRYCSIQTHCAKHFHPSAIQSILKFLTSSKITYYASTYRVFGSHRDVCADDDSPQHHGPKAICCEPRHQTQIIKASDDQSR